MRVWLEKAAGRWPVVAEALTFTKVAHGDTLRKYTGLPYWTHCADVAELVASVTDDPEMIAAALLHDTVEDTAVKIEDIEVLFGMRVAGLVDEVTNRSKPEHGNRAKRVAIDRAHLANSSADGATIKLADLIDNTKSIREYDPKFAKTYLREKAALLEVLKHGHPTLWEIAHHHAAKEG